MRHDDGGVVERVNSLDGIRGVAVAMVFLYHAGQPMVSGFLLQSGVDLFFVLSGFLITTILMRTSDRSDYFRKFYARRSVRIFPLYYLVFGITVGLAWLSVRYGFERSLGFDAAENMVQNQIWGWVYQINNLIAFKGTIAFAGLPHLWSLAIEEQFYLMWPMVVRKVNRERFLAVCIGVAAFSMVLRCVTYPLLGHDFAYYFTFCRFDGLALGSAGALIIATPRLRERFRPAIAWIGRHWWLVFVLVLMPEQAALYAGFTILSVGYLGFVLAAHEQLLPARITRWLGSRALQELGKYSYALYVFSVPVTRVVDRVNPTKVPIVDSTFHVVVSFAIVYGLARLSWKYWESPWMRLKSRFAYQAEPVARRPSGEPAEDEKDRDAPGSGPGATVDPSPN